MAAPGQQPSPPPAAAAAAKKQRLVPAPPSPAARQQEQQQHHRDITLAVIGDVHSQWDADSEAALSWLGADVAIFVGDFGEERVQMIQQIAAIQHPKAVILGNHDAWFSLTPSGRRRYMRAMMQSSSLAVREQQQGTEGISTPAIGQQLDALGGDHVGYGSKRFPHLALTLLGGRPFSKGGKQWSNVQEFYEELYGIGGHLDSAMRMLDVALEAPVADCKVLVAHNGPTGLGARRHNICGVDWMEPEADHGDPDLQDALAMMHSQGVRVPLVLFGHMHSHLKGGGSRNMVEVDAGSGTVYLNAAVVPRIRSFQAPSHLAANSSSSSSNGAGGHGGRGDTTSSSSSGGASINGHHFLLVEIKQQVVTAARDVWVGVQHTAAAAHGSGNGGGAGAAVGGSSRQCVLLQQQDLLRTSLGAPAAGAGEAGSPAAAAAEAGDSSTANYVCSIYRGQTGEWEPVVLPLPAGLQLAPC